MIDIQYHLRLSSISGGRDTDLVMSELRVGNREKKKYASLAGYDPAMKLGG